ncbi:F-box/kelch-repeat protein At1g57790 [Linum grandiflorum]
MYFPKSSNLYEFYDPARRKTYFMELPELSDSQVCHAKDGWLLLRKPNTQNVFFFFNPFSQETIELPKFKLTFQIVAFSCQPTAGTSCIVLTLKHVSPTEVEISTCSPGSTEWVTSQYANRSSFLCSMWNKIVFCNGRFYCLSLTGRVGVFDPSERTWTVLAVPPPKCPESVFVKYWSKWKGKFMVVSGGEIVVVCTCTGQNPNVFRLDEEKMVWEEITSLNGLALFVSSLSSHSRTDLNGNMRNNVFFPKVRFFGRRCTCYSMDDGRYYPCKQPYDWGQLDPFARIWIDAPGDLSSFLEKDSTLLQF